MPRENRKRGKKHKKQHLEEEAPEDIDEPQQQAGPSWIVQSHARGGEEVDPNAPFGYVDPDVKAYFKTVDTKLREWQEMKDAPETDEGEEADPNEERRLFLVAALTELSGKEKQLATDPECSNVLERMAYSMDDFVKRVLMDRIAGSYEQLCKHRFGSHVVQTLISVAKGTVYRETKGIFPPAPESDTNEGSLPTLTQLVLSLCEELLPSITSLIIDPFASHVLRALFLLLCPSLPSSSQPNALRSKKSAKHRAKQGPMTSVFRNSTDEKLGKGKEALTQVVYPPEFDEMARRIIKEVRERLSENEVRALAADKVACPVLALLLEMESIQGSTNEAGSLMDSVTVRLVSACLQKPPTKQEPSDYVATLLREPTSSHLLEKIVSLAPPSVFDVMWEQYFKEKLNKLAVHPVANFVVARTIDRLNAKQLAWAIEELEGSWSKIIKSSRTGVLKALIDRSAEIKASEKEACNAVLGAFGIDSEEKYNSLVMCMLYLQSYEEFVDASRLENEGSREEDGESSNQKQINKKGKTHLEPTVQGSVLVQSLLYLPEPHNQYIIDCILSQAPPSLLSLAHHPTSSRILDAFLSSPSVPARAKRKIVMVFLDHYHELVDDRIGSRVGDRLWEAADPYLKEKIARSLIPHEEALVGSFYGKFFIRGLNLYLLQRNPEEWKTMQAKGGKKANGMSAAPAGTTDMKTAITPAVDKPAAPETSTKSEEKKKRKRVEDKPEDEIDALFSSALGKKQKKGQLGPVGIQELNSIRSEAVGVKSKGATLSSDRDLDTVLGAIRTAPKELKSGKKKR